MSKPKQKNQINIEKNKRGSDLESLLHSEHIVTIEKLVVGGDGLARLIYLEKSLVVFVPKTAPQDKVKIKIVVVEKNHLVGQIIQLIEPSASRRHAPCEYFDNCGGCNWQHINENEQIQQKESILKDLLQKFLPNQNYILAPTVSSPKNFNYRNRIQLKQLNNQLGYFKKASHDIVDIDNCLLAENEISDQIKILKSTLRPTIELKKIELRINHQNKFESYAIGQDGEGLSFSQVNREVNVLLVSAVVDIVQKISPKKLTELYAGAGNFTFSLLHKLPDVLVEAAELNSKLTQFANQKMLELNLQKRLFFFTTNCESYVERRNLSHQLVLLDPPRAGCSEEVLAAVKASNTQNILYISCHPAHLARDLRNLTKSTDYQLKHLQIFDMFPQTDHFETLVWLQKENVH